jgi:hypothetical protein
LRAGHGGRQRAERRICRPARRRGAARHEEREDQHRRRQKRDPVRQHVQERKRHVVRADLQRHEIVPEAADEHVRDEEEHHDGTVHRHDRQIELRQHDAALVAGGQQLREQWPLLIREAELQSNERRERRADDRHQQAGHDVLDADDFVIGAEDVAAKESARVFVGRREGLRYFWVRSHSSNSFSETTLNVPRMR